jgi:hypothetical protein
MTSNTIDKINEITTFDEKEFLLNKSKVDFSVDDDAYDKRWNNTYEYRNSDKEFVLTDKGYELKNNSKAWYYTKDIGKGFLRGGVKLTEGVGSLALATLEKMNIVSEGSVENFANFYQENIYEKIGDTETMAGGFAEGIGQFIIPGIGAYGMFAKIYRAKGVWPFIYRALSAEAVTVGVAQVPGDPNFAAFISQMLGVDNTKADNIAKEFWNYIVTPDVEYGESYNADDVFSSKLKAIIGDAPLGPVGETLVPLFQMFAKGVRKLRGNKEVIEEIDKNIVKASDQEVFTVKQEFEKFQSSERVVSGKENIMAAIKSEIDNPSGAGGFTMTLDGKDIFKDLKVNSGYMVAPLKETELKIKVQGEFTMKDLELLDQNMFALEKTLKENNVDYGEVYFGAYKSGDFYVFEPSVKIDNLDQALYIGMAGKQESIFDLAAGSKGDFDNAFIQTTKDGKEVGYGQIKDKSVFDKTRSEQGTTTSNLQEGFISTRSKVQAGGNI